MFKWFALFSLSLCPLIPLPAHTLLHVDRGLVAAGLKDLSRPAEVISVPQNLGTYLSFLLLCTFPADHALLHSSHCDRIDLGQIFIRHHSRQLLIGSCQLLRCWNWYHQSLPSMGVSLESLVRVLLARQ